MITNIGIGFISGKRHSSRILSTYINNWIENGLLNNKQVKINLLIAGGLGNGGLSVKDFKDRTGGLYDRFDSVILVNKEYIDREIRKITSTLKIAPDELKLVFGEENAKKRNLILYTAIKMKLDSLIFLNDDEYPIASLKNDKGQILWMGQSIVGMHQKYITKADISIGLHCGYISPIPFIAFNNKLPEKDFRLFIETISDEHIQWNIIRRYRQKNEGIAFANESIIKNETVAELQERKRTKFINKTNLCFNLRKGKAFPPFFNPPGVRAEFSFLSTCLNDFKILKVPCYSFRDGFGMYKSILSGVLPNRFEPADKMSEEVVKEFINTCTGWMRSKPLMVFIMQTGNYDKVIQRLKSNLDQTIPKLCNYFGTHQFEQLYADLDYYDRNVRKHYNQFSETRRVWSLITSALKK